MSYEMIDRYLRNNLHDDDYADYSAALDAVAAGKKTPLTEAQIEDCIDAANRKFNGRRQGPCGQQMTTYDDWKHWLAREIEGAHGIRA